MKKLLTVVVVLIILYLIPQPSNSREWSKDQMVLPEIIISGDDVSIKNVRDNVYRSSRDYDVRYYDLDFNLSSIKSVEYIVEPFGSIGSAHTFLTFDVGNGEYVSVSVEIRKEEGESFGPVAGLLKQYEIMYVVANERDVINLRVKHRKDDLYLYPTTATPEVAQNMFVDISERVNALRDSPEFYNTLTNTCTTNIVDHVNKVLDKKIGPDFRIILPKNSDALALELGFINTDMSLDDARLEFKINDNADSCNPEGEEYSVCIRK